MTPRDDSRGGRALPRGGARRPRKLRAATPTLAPPARDASLVWHEVESGGYEADLELWEELADEATAAILELGCGTGRVGLHLAGCGHPITGIDSDAALVAAFNEEAGELPAIARVGDARHFDLEGSLALALAPMQLIQLLCGAEERLACLSCIASHLGAGGRAALAIVEGVAAGRAHRGGDYAPDFREIDGWIYSSLPLETEARDGQILIHRLRQTISPAGELSEVRHTVRLRALDAATLEREGEAAGLRPAGRRSIPDSETHVGSTVVLLRREG